LSENEKKDVEHILVLCVDRDDDIGKKTGIQTPIFGREENLQAATSLLLKDPEEADGNAMFEAIRVYDRLCTGSSLEERNHEIVTIAGSELRGMEADRKLTTELTHVLKTFPATGVILVTDGFADEEIRPLIQSRVPVVSVRRVVVRHSESIEETVAVFSRYLKLLTQTPRYARVVIGLPGILFIILAILYLTEMLKYAWIAFFMVVGFYLFIKGFGLDEPMKRFYFRFKSISLPPLPVQIAGFGLGAGLLLILIGFYQGAYVASSSVSIWDAPATFLGLFIEEAVTLSVVGVCTIFVARLIRWILERDRRLWQTMVIIVVSAWSWFILTETAKILVDPTYTYNALVVNIIIGIIITVSTTISATILHKRYQYSP